MTNGAERRGRSGVARWILVALMFLTGGAAVITLGVSRYYEDERYEARRARLEAEADIIRAARAPRLDYGAEPRRLSLGRGRTMEVRSLLNVDQKMSYGNFIWNEENVPDGPVQVRVDLGRQTLSVFRGGHEIGTAVIIYGSDGKPTPTGSFPVMEKNADYHSRTYDAPMPYMLRLTADGVAIHGSKVRWGWATHGCVGVPLEFARLLFEAVHKGDTVTILPIGETTDDGAST